MKSTGLKTFVANVSRTNFVSIKLYTDEGIDGVGEATLEWKTLAVVAALEELERQLVDRDPFASDALVEQLHRDGYWRTGAVCRTALGAVEAAMLDIKGKALGVPVFELLGGRHRDRVACYANHRFSGARTGANSMRRHAPDSRTRLMTCRSSMAPSTSAAWRPAPSS
jgi:galactonate dehydratase